MPGRASCRPHDAGEVGEAGGDSAEAELDLEIKQNIDVTHCRVLQLQKHDIVLFTRHVSPMVTSLMAAALLASALCHDQMDLRQGIKTCILYMVS